MRTPRPRHLTPAKVRRALDALIDVMQTEEAKGTLEFDDLDRACDALRRLDGSGVR